MELRDLNLFLIGFMGAGKSYVGKRLAQALELRFVDLDEWIVTQSGRSIPELFAQRGEAGFRAVERNALHHLPAQKGLLVACGGGTPCFHDNMEWINERGISIFLNASSELLVRRLLPETEQRPLLAGKGEEELRTFLTTKLAERRPHYEKAQVHYRLETGREDVVEELRWELVNIVGH
ncbi:MAG: shikimate kinase [Bacteroidota bacterium]